MHNPDDIRSEVRELIGPRLAGGFDSIEIVRVEVREIITDDGEVAGLDAILDQELCEAMAVRRAEQKSWPSVTDCDRLDAAFEELNEMGIMARHNWTCCSTCGRADMPGEYDRIGGQWEGVPIVGYTFYHIQDVDAAVKGQGIYLNYGSTEQAPDEESYLKQCLVVAETVKACLQRNALRVRWDGSYEKRIGVDLDWKRRGAPPRFCGT